MIRNQSEYSDDRTEVRRENESRYDDGASAYSSGSVIMIGHDGGSSYNGSDTQSQTTIKQLGQSQRSRFTRNRIRGPRSRLRSGYNGGSQMIVDDYQS